MSTCPISGSCLRLEFRVERRPKSLPKVLVLEIFRFLNVAELLVVSRVGKCWKVSSDNDNLWKMLCLRKITSVVGDLLFKGKNSWKKVMEDLCNPLPKCERNLTVHYRQEKRPNDEQLTVLKQFPFLDENQLKETLESLKKTKCLGLLNNGADFQMTALQNMTFHNKLTHAKILIEYGAKEAFYVESYQYNDQQEVDEISRSLHGRSALFYAAYQGNVSMVRLLLEEGALVDLIFERVYDNFEPCFPNHLILALIANFHKNKIPLKEHLECFLLLINAWKGQIGAKVVKKHEIAKKAIKFALDNGYWQIADLLMGLGIQVKLKNHEKLVIAIRAFQQKDRLMIQWLHDRKVIDFVNFRSCWGHTILHYCIAWNAGEMIDFLIKLGVPTHEKDHHGQTYLESGYKLLGNRVRRAILHKIDSMVYKDPLSDFRASSLEECLLNPIDLNVPMDASGNTLLHDFARNIFRKIDSKNDPFKLLVEHGANPHLANKLGETPITIAKKILQEQESRKIDFPEDYQRAEKRLEWLISARKQ